MNETADVGRNRKSLVILFAIGFLPLIIAWIVFFYFPQLMPSGTTNEGTLIDPPVIGQEAGIDLPTGKWALLLPLGPNCDAPCEERFYLARQVNVALGKESERVTRVLVNLGAPPQQVEALLESYPDLIRVDMDAAKAAQLPAGTDAIYLMDPVGNVFMSYEGEQTGKPMLKDIKHLLKISNIG